MQALKALAPVLILAFTATFNLLDDVIRWLMKWSMVDVYLRQDLFCLARGMVMGSDSCAGIFQNARIRFHR